MENSIRVYKVTEVAELLRVSRATVYNYLNSGELKSIKIGGNRRVTQEQLQEFIKKYEQ
ncbi:MAG: helix-turn-helix domain-containing protein [Enterococcus sp.]|nr:helix-turn-helix domain-containing protein [Enterococcus sp.]